MAKRSKAPLGLRARVAELEQHLAEARETLLAIRESEVDALVACSPQGNQVFTVKGTESLYRVVLDTMGEGVLTVGSDGTILYCNANFADMIALPLEKVLGKPMYRFVAYDQSTAVHSLLQESRRQTVKSELTLLSAKGRKVPVYASARSLPDAESPAVCLVVTDISPLKQVERTRAQLEAIAESTDDAIVSTTPDGTLLSWNPGAERMFGYSAAEALGRSVTMLTLADRVTEFRLVLERISRGEQVIHFQSVSLQKNGQLIPVSISASPICDHLGHVIACSAIARDITEQRRLEIDVLKATELERERIGRDLHDSLGQNLLGLAFRIKALKDGLAKTSKGATRDLDAILEMTNASLGQVRKLARGLHPVEVQPDGLVRALKNLAADASEQFRISCRFRHIGSTVIQDRLTASHLYYIAREAVTNAIKHGKAGKIAITFKNDGEQLILKVKDNGQGFPAKPLESQGLGLRTMAYRAGVMGASLGLRTASRGGAMVTCSLPQSLPLLLSRPAPRQ